MQKETNRPRNFKPSQGVRWDTLCRRVQGTIDTSSADPQSLGDLRWSNAFGTQTLNLRRLHSCSRGPALVFAFGLGLGDA